MSGLYITHMQYVVLGASAKVTLRGEILHPTSPRCQIEGKNIMYNTKSSMVKPSVVTRRSSRINCLKYLSTA